MNASALGLPTGGMTLPWAYTRLVLARFWSTTPWVVDEIWRTDPGEVREALKIMTIEGEARQRAQSRR